ncbi:MAG: Dabb family protein [Lachnospiraceae bacterium]|nr:Dabb family protein [Lachnospiraceae bacterium]
MVKHVILWKLKEELSDAEKSVIKENMKKELEGLKGKVPGLLDITIQISPLASSNAEVMLDSTLESEEALKGYAVHPEHVKVADTFVRPYTQVRTCMDYEI